MSVNLNEQTHMETNQKILNRYVVLLFGIIIQLCAGVIYMWSIFRTPVAQHLSWVFKKHL